MNLRDGDMLNMPIWSSAEGALDEAMRLMALAKASSQDLERERYERQALQLYQEAMILDREATDNPAYAGLQEMWIDMGCDLPR